MQPIMPHQGSCLAWYYRAYANCLLNCLNLGIETSGNFFDLYYTIPVVKLNDNVYLDIGSESSKSPKDDVKANELSKNQSYR